MPRRKTTKSPPKPLEVVKAVERLVTAARQYDVGPCGTGWYHRWTEWTEEPIGAFVLRSRECKDCAILEGVMFRGSSTVEQVTVNHKAEGSSPSPGANLRQ